MTRAEAIDRVRSFNRTVTERIGALHDEYLGRNRSLGESRLLWEIGDAAEIRTLRGRLKLDSGYLSRLLRKLEATGLVAVTSSVADRRVRVVRPTDAGRREQRVLDERSDELAASLLAPLSVRQQDRLVSAMTEVQRLLTAGRVRFDVVDPESRPASHCLAEYFAELGRRFDDGFDDRISVAATADQLRPPNGLFVVATVRDEPVGCGALKFHGAGPAELKRMWVAPSMRGLGLGRLLLHELERLAVEHGVCVIRLETNRNLTEAIALYRSEGYVDAEPFNDEPYAHLWFEKSF